MNLTEDRLRAALRETAGEIPAGSVPPLDFPPDARPARGRGSSWLQALQRRRWPAAVAATAAVCLVIGLSVAVSGIGQRQHHPPGGLSSLLYRVPRYYMTMLTTNWRTEPEEAVLHDTVTGAVVATIRPPSPFVTFNMMVAAPDDRTFVLAARAGHSDALLPSQLYLARLDPASHSVKLTRAPIPEFPAKDDLQSFGVSPDGKELAVGLAVYGPNGHAWSEQIRIYSLTGRRAAKPVKVWTGSTSYAELGYLSWVRTGVTFTGRQGLSVLDTHARSGSLQRASRLVWPIYSKASPLQVRNWGPLTGSGTAMVTQKPSTLSTAYSYRLEFDVLSVATGKLLRTVGPQWPTQPADSIATISIIWVNMSGSALVVEAPPIAGKPRKQSVLGIVGGNGFEPIPGAPPVLAIPSFGTQFAF